jgi:hypothetical protein
MSDIADLKRRAESVLFDCSQSNMDGNELCIIDENAIELFARIVKAACEWREFWDPENGWCESRREALDAILRGEGPRQ